MRVTVKLFARLRDIAGSPELARDVAPGATIGSVWRELAREWYAQLQAPIKRVFSHEDAAHSVSLEQFEAFHRIPTEIIVPETWVVDDRTMPIMGGVGNETRPPAGGSPPTLVLRGVMLMGGVNIRN